MALDKSLMGIGMPAEVAIRAGYRPVTIATTAATQGTGLLKKPGNQIVAATFTTAADAVTLPSDAEIGDEILVDNVSANAGVIFPPTGGTINGNAANASVAIAASGTVASGWWFVKMSATRWRGWAAADA